MTATLPDRLLAEDAEVLRDVLGDHPLPKRQREAVERAAEAAALSGREAVAKVELNGLSMSGLVYTEYGIRANLRDGTLLYTTPQRGDGVVVPDALLAEVRKLCSWKHLMSYNDSYFGEPSGELKSTVYAIERSIPAAPSAKGVA